MEASDPSEILLLITLQGDTSQIAVRGSFHSHHFNDLKYQDRGYVSYWKGARFEPRSVPVVYDFYCSFLQRS